MTALENIITALQAAANIAVERCVKHQFNLLKCSRLSAGLNLLIRAAARRKLSNIPPPSILQRMLPHSSLNSLVRRFVRDIQRSAKMKHSRRIWDTPRVRGARDRPLFVIQLRASGLPSRKNVAQK